MSLPVKPILALAIIFSIYGCSAFSLFSDPINPNRNQDSLEAYNQWLTETRQKLQDDYLGVRKQKLISDFGKPDKVLRNVGVSVSSIDTTQNQQKMVTADEVWIYNFSKGTPFINELKYAFMFYIQNDLVIQTKP